jgi:hypothetical protein
MPHIISHSYRDSAHPLFATKGRGPRDSFGSKKNKDMVDTDKDEAKVPRSYDSIKEAAGAKEQVKLRR